MMQTRPAELEDVRDISSAIQSTGGPGFYKAVFGAFHLPTLLDMTYLSLLSRIDGHETEDHPNIVEGFVSISDSIPLLPESSSFERVITALKNFIPVNRNNAMFINFWLVASVHAQVVGSSTNLHQQQVDEGKIAQSIVTDMFARCPHLDFLIWICPSNFVLADHIQQLFSPLHFDAGDDLTGDMKKLFQHLKILFLHRSRYLPKLFVRPARVEDNDDLLPIIKESNPEILDGQEHYFLADLIQSSDGKNHFFVGLKDHIVPVGFLATNVDVNMALITKIFDIDNYPDLVIQSDYVPPPPPLLIAIVGDVRLIDLSVLRGVLDGDHCLIVDFETVRVDWKASHGEDDVHNVLRRFVDRLAHDSNDTNLQAVILWGFPTSEDDAHRLAPLITAECDVVLELVNTSEDVDEDDGDDFLQRHLDAVEVVREYFFMEENSLLQAKKPFSNSSGRKAQWRKISFDKETAHQLKQENVTRFFGALSVCFDERQEQVQRARQIQQEKPPVANGFAVTALCMEESFLSRSIDLLKIAFEEQPHLAYCLFMVPNDFPTNQSTGAFSFVKTRQGVSFDQSLYILHRSFFFVSEHLRLERFQAAHFDPAIMSSSMANICFSGNQTLKSEVDLSITENDVALLDNPSQVTFGVFMGPELVGMFTFSRRSLSPEDVLWLRAHYYLEDFVNFSRHRLRSQYIMTTWVLDPVFSHWTRLILQHALRTCGKSVLYYQSSSKSLCPPKEILEEFVFVRPRRRQGIVRPRPASIVKEDEQLVEKAGGADCPLFCITKNRLAHAKLIISRRMVVVGGSPHSYAFLETFTSLPTVYLPNVFFVVSLLPSPLQVGLASHLLSEADRLVDGFSGELSVQDVDFPQHDELWAFGYGFRINVLRGHLTDIDREQRAVVLSDDLVVEYDYLLISSPCVDHSARRISSLSQVHPAKCADAGIFGLGYPAADFLALQWCLKRTATKADPIVIAGGAVKALAAAEGLIRAGLPANKIICVTRDEKHKIVGVGGADSASSGDAPELCNALVAAAEAAGLRAFLWGCEIAEVVLSRNGFIQAVDLRGFESSAQAKDDMDMGESKSGDAGRRRAGPSTGSSDRAGFAMQKEPCVALLLCGSEDATLSCDRDVFAAINDCGLVFDGGAVVDLDFCTVDPNIYAASDFVRFSRVFRSELPVRRYNPREIGSYIALLLLHKHFLPHNGGQSYAPAVQQQQASRRSSSKTPPARFSLARSVSARLPADMWFFASTLPDVRLHQGTTDFVTDTFSANSGNGPRSSAPQRVTSLKVSGLGVVSGVSYVGTGECEWRNLSQLPGQNEAYLNSAVYAHEKGLVSDWTAFFREPWAAPLFVDSFKLVVASLRQSLSTDKGMITLMSRIFERADGLDDDGDVSDYRRKIVGPHGEHVPEVTRQTVETSAVDFLRENNDVLPQFYMKAQGKEGKGESKESK